jgi:hypothetical protein
MRPRPNQPRSPPLSFALGSSVEVLAGRGASPEVFGLVVRGLRVELGVLGEVGLNLLVGGLKLLGEVRLVDVVERDGLLELNL